MEQKLDKDFFPGQKKGLIRVFIKRREQEEPSQMHFYLFDDEPKNDY